MKRLIYICIALTAVSCGYDDMRLQKPEELGTDKDEYVLDAQGGCAEISVYSNMEGEAFFAEPAAWAGIDNPHFVSDQIISVTVSENTGRPRMAALVLSTAARKDTVLIKQKGVKDEFLTLGATAITVQKDAGDATVKLNTNLDAADISFKTEYLDEERGWISGVAVRNGEIVISCTASPASSMRQAVVSVTYDNGWGEFCTLKLRVSQLGTQDVEGMSRSFAEIKSMAGQYPVEISEPYVIEGHIISDIDSGNVGENIQTTSTTINYSGCRKTAYFQAKEGGSGFLLEFQTEEDNIVTFNSEVSISLEGLTLARYTNPERYSLTGLKSSSVLSCTEVDPAEIVEKSCRMSALTDADLYTRVKITDCEFPIRKGSLTPLHEGYTSVTDRHRTTKFPTLIRDIEGNHMYMYTNTTCTYRRDGSKIGYGKGDVTGVLVHEKYRRFIDRENADEDECGNIGRYQVRHMAFKDLAFSENEGFSDFICEWRYIDTFNPDGSWDANLGTGTMTHSIAPDTRFLASGMTAAANDYSYLGPVYSTETHANENGFGIEGIDTYGPVKKEVIGKGSFSAASANTSKVALSWRNNKWYSGNKYQYWLVSFSTKGISTDILSMQLSVLNTSGGKCPNQWKAEWAESMDAESWNHIADYDVPDIVRDAITEPWQSPGYKPINITLPAEMLGKDNVYVRLTPRSRKGSSLLYLDSDFSNGSYSAMNHFAIRYNK